MRHFHKTLLALAFLGTAVSANAQDSTAPQAAPAAEQAAMLPAGIAQPPAGKGQIVFFRENKLKGAIISYIVREGETELGKLRNGTYFVHVTDPGQHTYVVHSEAKDVFNIEVEAGETHYVLGGISMGFMAGRPNLSPSNEEAFVKALSKLKPAPALDAK
ncbi:DUF2846 domain-containing protein [Lysobacter brunescens]|uniref:DUF2846 domain-containing protein n=1 Tax=Lysobacter brunescens TaxID=262323 RepID=A0ABW2YA63_9GAMM